MCRYSVFSIVCLFIIVLVGADCSNNPDSQNLTITKITIDDRPLDINNPSNVELGVVLTPDVLINFSQQVDLAQLKTKLKLAKDKPNAVSMPLTITKEDDVTIKVKLSGKQTLERNTTYIITITKDIRSVVQGVEYVVPNDISLKFSTMLISADADLSVIYDGKEIQGSLGMFIISPQSAINISSVPLKLQVSSGASLYENGSKLPLSKEEITVTCDFSSSSTKSFEVKSENKKVIKRYVVELNTNPIVSLYTGSGVIGQAVSDNELHDFEVATITNVFNFDYTISLGSISITRRPIGGSMTVMQRDLVNANAISGAKLTISYGNKITEMATYKPNELYTWQDLQAMRKNLSGDYILMQDVIFPDLGNDGFPLQGFEPIGKDTISVSGTIASILGEGHNGNVFSGTLDGNNKTISNLAINNEQLAFVGLFGKIEHSNASTKVLKDIVLKGVSVVGQAIAGGAVGCLERGEIENVGVIVGDSGQGIVKTVQYQNRGFGHKKSSLTGGLVGYVSGNGKVSECYSEVAVEGVNSNVGGLVGLTRGNVVGYAKGNVSGNEDVGGLVGNAHFSSGITGYATGDVHGTLVLGGLVGFSVGSHVSGYAAGAVSGYGHVGGLVGFYFGGSITGYATGHLTVTVGNGLIGGLIGHDFAGGQVEGYWDITSTGQNMHGRDLGVGISAIGNVYKFTAATEQGGRIQNKFYDSGGQANSPHDHQVFHSTGFLNIFDEPSKGAEWPKLKTSIFSLPQPDLP